MGQRANLIIVREGGYDLYYSHWAANRLDKDLFWGPAHALAFARASAKHGRRCGMAREKWAEGGAVLHTVRSRLVWSGGEDALYDVGRRRILLRLMGRVWRGWSVSTSARTASEDGVDRLRSVNAPLGCNARLLPGTKRRRRSRRLR